MSGAAASIVVKDKAGKGDVPANGAALAFPFQLANIQVAFQFTNATSGLLTTLWAPIIMVSSNQVNAMVPSGVAAGIGGGSATLVVQTTLRLFANIALSMRTPGFSLCPARAPVKQACSITMPPRALTRSIRLRTRPREAPLL